MKRGPKALPPSVKELRGTLQPCRDAHKMEIVAPDALPQMPEFLTEAGREVWLDNIGRVAATKQAAELDSELFAVWCNMQAMIRAAFVAGEAPPTTFVAEARKMAEQFGLFGAKSRVGVKDGSKPKNPFSSL